MRDRPWVADLLQPADLLSHIPPHSCHTHLLVTCATAGGSHPQAHLQAGVQGPLGGTCGILFGWTAVANIHDHSWGGIDAEGRVARGGRAVDETVERTEGHAGLSGPPIVSLMAC